MTRCEQCGDWFAPEHVGGLPRFCPTCEDYNDFMADDLPELTDEERAAMNALPPEFIERCLRGERPVTDPKTFAN